MRNIIVRTNGEPYATRNSAEQQLTKRFLRDTHEVVEYGGGFGLVPIEVDSGSTALRPGDYVSTKGMSEADYHAVAEAFMAAGANKGEYPQWEIYAKDGYIHGFGWSLEGRLYHSNFENGFGYWADNAGGCRQLTIGQVLGATNANAVSHAHAPSVIDTLHAAKRQREEAVQALESAEAVMREAMDAVRAELGDGFVLSEVGVDMADGPDKTIIDDEDMSDPTNWRKGDVVECVSEDNDALTKGRTYEVLGLDRDGDPVIRCDDGDVDGQFSRLFRFRHRPT